MSTIKLQDIWKKYYESFQKAYPKSWMEILDTFEMTELLAGSKTVGEHQRDFKKWANEITHLVQFSW